MRGTNLGETARAIVAEGKGILAAEKTPLKFSVFLDDEPPPSLLRGQLDGLAGRPRFAARSGAAVVGLDTVNTIPPATYDAFRDHGRPRASLTEDVEASPPDWPRCGPPC